MSLHVTGGALRATEGQVPEAAAGLTRAAGQPGAAGRPGGAGPLGAARSLYRSMAVRLWAGLALFAVLLLTAAGFIHDGVAQQDRSVDGLVGRLHPLEIANLEVRADFAQAQSVLQAYVLTREARFLSQYSLYKVALARAFGQARDHAADGELAGIAAENRAALTWLRYAGQMESRPAGSPALTQLTDQASDSAQNFYRASDR